MKRYLETVLSPVLRELFPKFYKLGVTAAGDNVFVITVFRTDGAEFTHWISGTDKLAATKDLIKVCDKQLNRFNI